MRSPFFIGKDNTLESFERFETCLLSSCVDVFENCISDLIIVAERREVVGSDAEVRSFRFEVCLVREDDLSRSSSQFPVTRIVERIKSTSTYSHGSVGI